MATIAEALGLDGKEVQLGGRTIVVRPFRLRDLAELEEWVAGRVQDPVLVALRLIEEEDPPKSVRRELLEIAHAERGTWPPGYGSPVCSHQLGFTRAGRLRLLCQILKRDRPEPATPEAAKVLEAEAAEILDGATESEFTRALAIAHGRDPAARPKAQAPATSQIGAELLLRLLSALGSEKPGN